MMLGIEEEILGSLILEPDNVAKLVISDEHFEDADNQFIFKLLKRQYSDDKTISLTGLFEKYKHLFNQRFPQDRILSKVVKISTDAMGTDFEYLANLLNLNLMFLFLEFISLNISLLVSLFAEDLIVKASNL